MFDSHNKANTARIRPIHPFPARMAPSIVEDILRRAERKRLRVLDPMAGSGTTLALARHYGHKAIGFDSDPMAVLLSQAWCADLSSSMLKVAERVLDKARLQYQRLSVDEVLAYFDEETAEFIRFWYDATNIKQLYALSSSISRSRDDAARLALWTALSRLIITKECGASRGIDISHSRPHRAYDACPVRPLNAFMKSVQDVLKRSPFSDSGRFLPKAKIGYGDARNLPLTKNSVDLVITSPPYLNAIDYLRGHKLSLVWMGHSIETLRNIRASNVGTESVSRRTKCDVDEGVLQSATDLRRLPSRTKGLLCQYALDMESVMKEIGRVLTPGGKLVMVVGNSTLKGQFIENSGLLKTIAYRQGYQLTSELHREIPANRRYLPPPGTLASGDQLSSRMREEVVLAFTC